MKKFLLKTWLTMLCLLVGVGTAWAEDEVLVSITNTSDWTISSTTYSNAVWRDASVGVCCNFAGNNNKGWAYVRLSPGKKSKSGDANKTGTGHLGTTNPTKQATKSVAYTIDAMTMSSITSANYMYSQLILLPQQHGQMSIVQK